MLFYRVISGSLVPKRASIMLWKWYSRPTLTVEQGLWNTPLGGTRPSSVSLARASVGRLGWDLGTRNQLKGNDISWPEQLNSPLQDSINVPFCYYNCLLLSLSLSQWEWRLCMECPDIMSCTTLEKRLHEPHKIGLPVLLMRLVLVKFVRSCGFLWTTFRPHEMWFTNCLCTCIQCSVIQALWTVVRWLSELPSRTPSPSPIPPSPLSTTAFMLT